MSLNFRLYPLRLFFAASTAIYFPPGKSANLLRGGFGTILRRIACAPGCANARQCELRGSCPYARVFEPSALTETGPSGMADWPRPFVFRAGNLDGQRVESGGKFWFDLHVFDLASSTVTQVVRAFAELAHEGLGPGRGQATLERVEQLGEHNEPVSQVHDGSTFDFAHPAAPVTFSLAPLIEKANRIQVHFVTPTELKAGDRLAERPEFSVLATRTRDRLSALRSLYGAGPLPIDFRGFAERAAHIKLTRCELERVRINRRSSKTGQVHPIGGFTGVAEYEGEVAEFVPFLQAAKWTGVGRQTVWGKGELEVEACP